MNRYLLLAVVVCSSVSAAVSSVLRENEIKPSDWVDTGERAGGWATYATLVQGGSNSLLLIKASFWTNTMETLKTNSAIGLHVLLRASEHCREIGQMHGLFRGEIYRVIDWRTLGKLEAIPADIMSSGDNTRIVVMVLDNGPIYSSTNSGMTWMVINTPGKYRFPLTFGPDGSGWGAIATIHPSQTNQKSINPPPASWYAVGSASDGSKLVLNGDSSQPAPVLSITSSDSGAVVSWSATFTGFVLQETSDLTSTNWVDVTNSVTVVGEKNQVLISSPAGNNFYRLRSQ